MTPQDALHMTVMSYPGGAEALAARMGMNAQILRNKINPNSTSHHPSLHDIERIMYMTDNPAVLHSLAKGMSHTCTKIMSEGEANDVALLEHIAIIWKTNGQVGNEVHCALEDGHISQHELVRIKDAVHRTTTAMHDLIKRLEGMSNV